MCTKSSSSLRTARPDTIPLNNDRCFPSASIEMKRTTILPVLLAIFCCCWLAPDLFAQSLDASSPAPLTSREVTGRIVPLDIGDPRSTRHFYIFRAGPGDLILNVESTNLNGDVDLFTAVGLQPLLKISIYAASSVDTATKTSKSVFLRRAESIILRVEARTAGDAEGLYHLSFDGPFEAATPLASSESNSVNKPSVDNARTTTKTRRVNSVGARIEEPPSEVATPPPSTVSRNNTSPKTTRPVKPAPAMKDETTSSTEATPAPSSGPAALPVRRRPLPRARSTAARRRTTPPATSAPPDTMARNSERTTDIDEPPPKPVVAPRRSAPPTQNSVPVLNARLIIEMRDGEKIERPMSEVRRLTVERGILIIITNTGSLERRPMSTVLKVSIEP